MTELEKEIVERYRSLYEEMQGYTEHLKDDNDSKVRELLVEARTNIQTLEDNNPSLAVEFAKVRNTISSMRLGG